MRVVIGADDGDELTVVSDDVTAAQSIVRLEIHNPYYDEAQGYDWVILSAERARKLAIALLEASEAITSDPNELTHNYSPMHKLPVETLAFEVT